MFGQRRDKVRQQLESAWTRFIDDVVHPPYDVDTVLLGALEVMAAIVVAEGYYAYVADAPGGPLQLKATRASAGVANVGPHYAGLVTGTPLRRIPLEVARPEIPLGSTLQGPNTEPYLSIACGPDAVLRASIPPQPVLARLRLTTAQEEVFLELARRLKPILGLMLFAQGEVRQTETARLGASTQKRALELATRTERVLDLICRLSGESLKAATGYLAVWEPDQRPRLLWQAANAPELFGAWHPQENAQQLSPGEVAVWAPPRIPPAVADLGFQGLLAMALEPGGNHRSVIAFASRNPFETAPYMQEVLQELGKSLVEVMRTRDYAEGMGRVYLSSLKAAVRLLDAADPCNSNHSQYVSTLSQRVATAMGLDRETVAAVGLAGTLHDVGMAAIDLGIPLTRGTLSERERDLIRKHPAIGADLLAGFPPSVLPPAVERGVRFHHERWDGRGYPEGLAEENIPIEGRIVACAEIFVARLSARTYRAGLSVERALYEVAKLSGGTLDPAVVEALLKVYRAAGVEPKAPEV